MVLGRVDRSRTVGGGRGVDQNRGKTGRDADTEDEVKESGPSKVVQGGRELGTGKTQGRD